jgi:putative Mg2+ transporter-C (MgtC) family protein
MTMDWQIINQLLIAAFLGAVVGLERELAKKEAGIKTCSLVSLGAALFVIIPQISSIFISSNAFDPSRVLSQIIVGVGFIGAGVIMFQKTYISGVTTAASLWVVAGVGAAVGFKLYDVAIAATIISLIILVIIGKAERKFIGDRDE